MALPEEKTNKAMAFALAAGMIIFGTASTELSTIQFRTKSRGTESCDSDDDHHGHVMDCEFDKPYFNVLIMKFGMSLCYFLHQYEKSKHQKRLEQKRDVKLEGGETALIEDGSNSDVTNNDIDYDPPWSVLIRIIIPAFTDMVQTVLAMAGLIWVEPSIYQMVRGSVVIFSAILSVTWLKKTLKPRHVIAVLLVLLAIICVGVAGVEKTEDSDDDDGDGGGGVFLVILGLLLIVGGQFIGAIQFILEEELMVKYRVSPTQLVAWEGIWGGIILLLLFIPLAATPSGGSASFLWHEDLVDTLTQVKNSTTLIVTSVISVFVMLTYNWVGNMITKHLNAVARSMLEACRTIGVWTVGLFIYYVLNNESIGEQWTSWSFLELGGFIILVYGTLAYKDIIPINPLDLFKQQDDVVTEEVVVSSTYSPVRRSTESGVDKTSVLKSKGLTSGVGDRTLERAHLKAREAMEMAEMAIEVRHSHQPSSTRNAAFLLCLLRNFPPPGCLRVASLPPGVAQAARDGHLPGLAGCPKHSVLVFWPPLFQLEATAFLSQRRLAGCVEKVR